MEFFSALFAELLGAAFENGRLPKWLKLLLFSLLCGLLVLLTALVMVSAIRRGDIPAAVLTGAVMLGLLVLWGLGIRRFAK